MYESKAEHGAISDKQCWLCKLHSSRKQNMLLFLEFFANVVWTTEKEVVQSLMVSLSERRNF